MNIKKISKITKIIAVFGSVAIISPFGALAAAYTAADVAAHNTAGDCWMIISGKVYNVASYIPIHPGGVVAISAYCGKDATAVFASHPSVGGLLANYYVGDLVAVRF